MYIFAFVPSKIRAYSQKVVGAHEHAPTFIITGFTKEYVSLIHNETAFVVSRNLKKDTYDLFQAYAGGKGKPIFRLIGSFTNLGEMSQKLLYVVDDHQKSAHSKNKIDKDLINTLPALAASRVLGCVLIGVVPLSYWTYKWISRKFLLP